MAIFNRFTRLFKADVHAMLDQLEEPEALLRQAVREMEEELRKNTLRAQVLEQQAAQSQARSTELGDILKAIEVQLDLCFEAGNTDLAKNLIRRKLENQRLVDYVQNQFKTQTKEFKQLTTVVQQQTQKLEGMRQKAAIYDSLGENSCHSGVLRKDVIDADVCLMISELDVEIALLEEKKRRSL
jgi:phage shock protein A